MLRNVPVKLAQVLVSKPNFSINTFPFSHSILVKRTLRRWLRHKPFQMSFLRHGQLIHMKKIQCHHYQVL